MTSEKKTKSKYVKMENIDILISEGSNLRKKKKVSKLSKMSTNTIFVLLAFIGSTVFATFAHAQERKYPKSFKIMLVAIKP